MTGRRPPRLLACCCGKNSNGFCNKMKSCKSALFCIDRTFSVIMSCETFDNLIPPLHWIARGRPNFVKFLFNFSLNFCSIFVQFLPPIKNSFAAVQKWSVGQISKKCNAMKCRSEQICSCTAIFVVISIFEVIYSKYSNCCGNGLQTKVCSDGPARNRNVQLEEIGKNYSSFVIAC